MARAETALETSAALNGDSAAAAWSQPEPDLLQSLRVQAETGLTHAEAAARQVRFGPNVLRSTERRRAPAILLDQLKSLVVLLLFAAAVLSLMLGETLESAAILTVIVLNTLIGFVTEWKAVRSMEALRELGQVDTVVRRESRLTKITADGLVPGDILLLEAGDVVTADARLLESANLEVGESALTGESIPVSKQLGALPEQTPVMERSNMLFKGTAIAGGSATAVVVATGLNTELGRISQLVAEAQALDTPLEKRLRALGQRLVAFVAAIAVLVAVAGVITGRELWLAIEVAIALAVAAIPEGLPVVATIALARGMWRMAKRNALIARLSAVETLGATNVILADKTGTLTENRMTVTTLALPGITVDVAGAGLDLAGEFVSEGQSLDSATTHAVDELLTAAALCNNASITLEEANPVAVGDPTEVALLVAAAKRGLDRPTLLREHPEQRECAFSTTLRAMATFHGAAGQLLVAVKGAPESVLKMCRHLRAETGTVPFAAEELQAWTEKADQLATLGLRTLAIATKTTASTEEDPYGDLTLLGLVGILDPPRTGIREALLRCREAGIRVVMVTGDHLATARTVARQLGLIEPSAPQTAVVDARHLDAGSDARLLKDTAVIARATPEQKLDLIALFQKAGNVVAMTGDGVNDAPALKQADIGIAMGIRGTQVAKEAAAMVLQDDDFSTIVEAIAQGRTIYGNIRKFVVYLLSCNFSEILVISLATLAGAPLPLLPLQILFLNLVTDVFPALALGVGEASPAQMRRGPRPSAEPIVTMPLWSLMLGYGAVLSATVLGAMAIAVYGLGFNEAEAVSVSFCTLALAQLWHAFNMRDSGSHWLRNEITLNPWIWAALALCVVLILCAVYVPLLGDVLGLVDPGPDGWLLIVCASLIPLLADAAIRALLPRPPV